MVTREDVTMDEAMDVATTPDLIAWLRAQLDMDEHVAKRAAWDHPDWVYDRQTFTVASARSAEWSIAARKANGSPINDVDGEHIARHDPARVFAEVAAKRAIIDRHPHVRFRELPEEWPPHWRDDAREAFPGDAEPYIGCEVCDWDTQYEVANPGWWCEYVRALAMVYADQPGYRDEWRLG